MRFVEESVSPVSRSDGERLLAEVAGNLADPQAGIFGPASMSWRINRESALFLAAGRAAILQLAHPWVATALEQHSSLLADPIARFHNTFRIVFTMVFGSLDQAMRASRYLYTLHTAIRGELTVSAGSWPRGSHYEANEVGALRWVFATLVESAVLAYECAVSPLAPADKSAYYAESKILAGLFGIPANALPETLGGFIAYCAEMANSPSLAATPAARSMAHGILHGAGSWIHPPRWYRSLTVGWLPATLRSEFGLQCGAREERSAARARRWLPRIYRNLPAAIRFVGPWHEARARLAERSPGLIAGWSNRFWIGQPRLPFCNEDRLV